MADRTYSNLAKWGVDFQDGNGMRAFTPQPADFNIIRIDDPDLRLDGQENTPMFWDIDLKFNLLTAKQVGNISRMWNPNLQKIRLNYASAKHFGDPATGGSDSGWVIDDAVWKNPPLAKPSGTFKAIVLYDLVIPIHRLAWDGASPDGSGTGGDADAAGGFYGNIPVQWTLTATAVNNTSVALSWTNISGPTTGIEFVLFNGLNDVATEASGVSTYTMTGLTASTQYRFYFLVRDTTTTAYVAQSNVITVTTIA